MFARPTLALAVLLAATPALADDAILSVMGRKLDKPSADGGHVSAVIACWRGAGDAERTVALFTEKDWSAERDGEMGLIYLSNPAGDLGATLAANGGFCEVASDSRGTDLALQAFVPMLAAGGLSYDSGDGPDGCPEFRPKPGVRVSISSTGQDPVCASATTSAVRVTFEG